MVSKASLFAVGNRLLLVSLISAACLGAEEASGSQLTASWVDNSNGAATTRLERRLATDVVFVALADVPAGLTGFVDGSLSPGTTYCYRAFAYNADGVSPYSDEVCATSAVDASDLTLTVSKTGAGTGTVASTPAGIACGTTCSATFAAGTSVTLAATPDIGSVFTGWSSGGCSGTLPCTVGGNTSVAVTATFSPVTDSYTLTVATTGPGSVTSNPAGISCSSDCSEAYPSGTKVTLTAKPNSNGAIFFGWSGACTGTSLTCTVSMQAAIGITAAFKKKGGPKIETNPEETAPVEPEPIPQKTVATRKVQHDGATTRPGPVTGNPAGIGCGSDCSETYARGTKVTLTAKPNNNGACTGSSLNCTVSQQAATGITAASKKKGEPDAAETNLDQTNPDEAELVEPELTPPQGVTTVGTREVELDGDEAETATALR